MKNTLLALAVVSITGLAHGAELPMRLPDGVRPLGYELELRVDPDQPKYSGQVRIEVQLDKPMSELRLHARKLSVSKVQVLNGEKGKATIADINSIWLRFPHALPSGKSVLTLAFSGRLEEAEPFGFFRLKDGKRWYVYTQFEDIAARRAFPSFDEPGRKVPWHLTLVVPKGQQAFSNTPVQQSSTDKDGWQRITFEQTKPLPSYLVAWAVGPMDVVDGGKVGGTKLRYLVPKGRGSEAAYARQSTPAVLAALENYFGTPHPFPKLDSVAMPLPPGAFGAMEHPGLITYESSLMLAPVSGARAAFETDYVSTAAHEIAHQWVGNLVTLAWWNDLWLNESFASWLGDKITAQVQPGWQWELRAGLDARRQALAADRLPTARRVRQPVETNEDLGTAFNAITYQKGQTVLAMFEAWLGETRMRDAVRSYIAAHAGGNVKAEDLYAALAAADRPELAQSVASFIEQPGVPRVEFKLDCSGAKPAVELKQQRFVPVGAQMPAQTWIVPVVMRTPAGETRTLLASSQARVELPDAACPAWLQPDASGLGYYVAEQSSEASKALQASGPNGGVGDPRAQMRLLEDRLSLARAGSVPLDEALALLDRLAGQPQQPVREAALLAVVDLQLLLADADKPAYARQLQRLFGADARALGWLPKSGEPEDVARWRAELLPVMAAAGGDLQLREQALGLARTWLKAAQADGEAHAELIAPLLRGGLLSAVAEDGDAALFDGMLAAARKSRDAGRRAELLGALTNFRAPTLQARARALLQDKALDPHEILPELLRHHAKQAESRQALLTLLQSKAAWLAKNFGEFDRSGWPTKMAEHACGRAAAQDLQNGFGATAKQLEGGVSVLTDAVQLVELCGTYRDAQAAGLARFLNRP
ncbi:M1 family metallopeptidase [Burkholderiaceae bacterium UC74_6]